MRKIEQTNAIYQCLICNKRFIKTFDTKLHPKQIPHKLSGENFNHGHSYNEYFGNSPILNYDRSFDYTTDYFPILQLIGYHYSYYDKDANMSRLNNEEVFISNIDGTNMRKFGGNK